MPGVAGNISQVVKKQRKTKKNPTSAPKYDCIALAVLVELSFNENGSIKICHFSEFQKLYI